MTREGIIGFVGYIMALVAVANDSWSAWVVLPLALVGGWLVGHGLFAERN